MNAKLALAGIVAVATLSAAFSTFYVVDQGERGVVLRNGRIAEVTEPGLHWKMPLIDKVETVDIRSKSKSYDNVLAYSADQQTAALAVSVNYAIPADKVATVYGDYGTEENLLRRLIDRKLMAQVKNVFGQYTASRAIQERAKLNADMQLALQEAVIGPVSIEALQVENIDFSDAYEQKIEERMSAEIEVQKLKQNAEKEKVQAEITVTQAKAQADSTLAKAEADAAAIRAKGEAEAEAIRAKGAALRDNPNLVQLTAAEKWNGVLPTTMVPGSATPFVNVK